MVAKTRVWVVFLCQLGIFENYHSFFLGVQIVNPNGVIGFLCEQSVQGCVVLGPMYGKP